ncbi:DNA cytosine methyltransferase [Methylobacillus pratensis]
MKYLSVCSGIEAATLAWHPLGWKPVAFSEIEAFPCALLAHHYPDVPNWGDMTKYQEWPDAVIDILVGGTPCQSFSVAGLRKGLADPRGNLMLTYGAIAAKYRPTWLVWENVPGVLSSEKGKDFASFLGLITGQEIHPPAGGWKNSGIVPGYKNAYGVAWRVLDAQYFGVPQRRRRVFVVGYIGDWRRAAAVLFERHSMSGHPAPRRKPGENIAATVRAGVANGSKGHGARSEDSKDELIVPVAPTIPSRDATGGGLGTDFDLDGGLVPTLDASFGRLQGCSGQDSNHGHSHLIVAFGGNRTSGQINVAPSLLAHPGSGYKVDFESETFITHALRAEGFDASEDGTGRGTPLVHFPFDTTQITSPDNGSNPQPGDPCHPLAASAHPPAIAFQSSQSGVRTDDVHATLDSNNGSRRHNGAVIGMRVRRLIPRECERLQGMPDDYTLIPWRGKPAIDCPDGPRYKAIGNSMAVPNMRWIGKRIQQVDELIAQLEAA